MAHPKCPTQPIGWPSIFWLRNPELACLRDDRARNSFRPILECKVASEFFSHKKLKIGVQLDIAMLANSVIERTIKSDCLIRHAETFWDKVAPGRPFDWMQRSRVNHHCAPFCTSGIVRTFPRPSGSPNILY
jgi:hypothetical protein